MRDMLERMALKNGDHVTFFYWTGGHDGAGKLSAADAVITEVHKTATDEPRALGLIVDFPPEILAAEGFSPVQTHSRERLLVDNTVHASGTWAEDAVAFPLTPPTAT